MFGPKQFIFEKASYPGQHSIKCQLTKRSTSLSSLTGDPCATYPMPTKVTAKRGNTV